ncbi:hypothetical protein J1N35_013487 [Gossypium stocksii]|uniref:Large ribosomal subunit protein uL2 RNA-binding domain-containing protein n=1 Tax=Gossypium stocksii TaxID=47602 RepID=A0A9D3VU02_9ROSI|nr:hypothetical protein J1N35_013487 [Gossypium stocksii]
MNGRIATIEYDPNRNACICLIHYGDGKKRYILHPRGAIIGDTIVSGTEVYRKIGNALPFSANLLLVFAPLPHLSLSGRLGALVGDPSCFPLDNKAYPPSSHWLTSTLVIMRCPVNYCASTHFGENQVALGSSGVSPLITTHPLILQHQSVRTST